MPDVQTFSGLYLGLPAVATTFKVSRCTGGEVRIDLEITMKREDVQMNRFEVFAKMYEGASCSNDDYDGGTIDSDNNAFLTDSILNTGAVKLDVKNKYEGGDFAPPRSSSRQGVY